MKYIKFRKIDHGYRIIKTGEVFKKSDFDNEPYRSLRNRPGIDAFEHLGYKKTKRQNDGKAIKEVEEYQIVELDVDANEASGIVADEPDLEPYILSDDEVEILIPPAENNIAS